jgi:hypothetical protein
MPSAIDAEPLVTATGIGRFEVIAGRGDPLEIFGIARGRFLTVGSSGATELYQFATTNDEVGVASGGRGDAVAAGQQPEAVHYRSGAVEVEPTPFPADSLLAVTHTGALGYVAGTSLGQVVRYTGDRWESLGDTGFSLGIRTIAPYPRGFVYGGANGGVGQYVEGRGFCAPSFPVSGAIRGVHVIGEQVIVVQKYLTNGIAILEPAPAE